MTDDPRVWEDFSASDIDDETQNQLAALAEL